MEIDRRCFVGSMGSALLLPGCATLSGHHSSPPTVPFESLVRQIKHDIGTYIFQHQDDRDVALAGKPCAGQISFTIQKVKITVTTTIDRSSSANAGLKVPIDIVTVEASGLGSRTLSDTITTSLTIWPLSAGKDAVVEDKSLQAQRLTAAPPPAPEFSGTPITDALNQLSNDLIRTADTAPCFNFGNGEQKDNSVKWAFSISDKVQAGGKLSLLVFSVGADSNSTRTFANAIEVGFIATGERFG